LTAFFLVEVNDGFYTEFSPSDMVGNGVGALSAVAMSQWPALDDAIDFRVQWFPSRDFRRHPTANFAEDYSGETYLLAFKPRSIPALRNAESPVYWLQFVNPVVAFASRNYKPVPVAPETVTRQQTAYVGLTLDVQAVVDATLGTRKAPAARLAHGVGHGLFEAVNLPFSTLPLLSAVRSP